MTAGVNVSRGGDMFAIDRLELHEFGRARAAAHHALGVYPGAVGQLLARELTAYAEFGRRFPRDGLTEAVVREILRRPRTR